MTLKIGKWDQREGNINTAHVLTRYEKICASETSQCCYPSRLHDRAFRFRIMLYCSMCEVLRKDRLLLSGMPQTNSPISDKRHQRWRGKNGEMLRTRYHHQKRNADRPAWQQRPHSPLQTPCPFLLLPSLPPEPHPAPQASCHAPLYS